MCDLEVLDRGLVQLLGEWGPGIWKFVERGAQVKESGIWRGFWYRLDLYRYHSHHLYRLGSGHPVEDGYSRRLDGDPGHIRVKKLPGMLNLQGGTSLRDVE